jgi:hypothetical protein
VLLQLTNDVGGGIVIEEGTHVRVTITDDQSDTLPRERRCPYDVEVTLPSGEEKTPVKGWLWVGWQASY